jgi:hypothetical protein
MGACPACQPLSRSPSALAARPAATLPPERQAPGCQPPGCSAPVAARLQVERVLQVDDVLAREGLVREQVLPELGLDVQLGDRLPQVARARPSAVSRGCAAARRCLASARRRASTALQLEKSPAPSRQPRSSDRALCSCCREGRMRLPATLDGA